MRIAYVSTAPVPSAAASGVQIANMCHAFTEHGCDVTLIAPAAHLNGTNNTDLFAHYGLPRSFRLKRPGRPSQSFAGRRLNALASASAAKALASDLVYTRSLEVAAVAVARGLPTVLELHSLGPVRTAALRALLRRLVVSPHLRHLVVISEALQAAVSGIVGPHARVVVAHDAARPIPEGTQTMPLDSGDKMTVGYMGGLYPGKGLELIRALAAQLSQVKFHVVGRVDPSNASPGRPFPTNVELHGYLAPAEGDRFRMACDVLIAPYGRSVEPAGGRGDISAWMSPLKLFEYMAAAKPIVCSDLPVLREIIADGRNGLLRAPDDVGGWVESLQQLESNPAWGRTLGHAALADFEKHHTYRSRAEKVLPRE